MKKSKSKGESPADKPTDARFANFETDPRFRLPSKKQGKTTIDKRFSRMLKDDEFVATAKVDRYGRKLKNDTKKKALQRLYDEEEDEEDEADVSVDEDEVVQRELRAAEEKYDPARGGGFESESEDESDSDEEEVPAHETAREGDLQRFQDQSGDQEDGEVTKRVAIVNLDWDHVRATDLYALFSSFIGDSGGSVERVSVYPSEFGKERMQQEELEGPPKELFKGNKQEEIEEEDEDEESDSDEAIRKQLMQEGDDQDFDSDALRSYQLDRLRYYYAVMVCSDKQTAQKIYEATDGTEYQSSSNFLDLRFVPDDVTFDDEPRDECDSTPEEYKPVEFVTNALQSSKVKLTWDMHPEEHSRKESIKRAFSGSRKEIDENDLKTYLASDSEDESDGPDDAHVEVVVAEGAEEEPKLSKKELARKKMREALGLSEESSRKSSKNDAVGDMQITFTPALSANEPKKAADEEETTIEKYKRKERERKERKRQQSKAKRTGAEEEESADDQVAGAADEDDDLGFNDPFFTNDEPSAPSKASIRKEERLKKRAAREAAEAESSAQKDKLKKVMAGHQDGADHLDHFDMNEIMRAEKQKRKKGKGKGKGKNSDEGEKTGLQEGFQMNVEDDRFKAVFEDHQFAIDPSNPKFKGTEGMKQLLEEGRKKRSGDDDGGREQRKKSKRR